MSTLTRSFTALVLLTLAACETNSSPVDEGAFDANMPNQDVDAAANDDGASDGGPTRDVVDATTPPDKITEEYGVFVSLSGNDTNEGSRALPFKTVQAGITHAATVGKLVFVCTGTYAEALVVADAISVVGGLDCSDPHAWKLGAPLSRIAAPSSPAVRATSITAPTRLESLAIVAPDATAPSASSIGVLADHAPGLTIVGSSITAGRGAAGTDGAGAIQLTLGASAAGAETPNYVDCGRDGKGCGTVDGLPKLQPGGAGGVGQCLGAPDHNGGNGGAGGTGGIWKSAFTANGLAWLVFDNNHAGGVRGTAGSGANSTSGRDGSPAPEVGTLTSDGYLAPSGSPGTDGTPGAGGNGGTGGSGNGPNFAPDLPDFNTIRDSGFIYAARGGAGGGAGGCPGLAGSAGTGGGASIGVALIASPIVLDNVAIASGNGGAAGLGSFGSDPTKGGDPGAGVTSSGGGAKPGGNGGGAGVSTNGANGPSFGILSTGAAPTLVNDTKATPGTGAPAINARMHRDKVGVVHTIPATPAGLAADVMTL